MRRPNMLVTGVLFAVLLAFCAGAYFGISGKLSGIVTAQELTVNPDQVPTDSELKQLWIAWNTLEQNFVDTTASTSLPSVKERVYGAIQGLTESYQDPYTIFLPPEEAKEFQDSINGAFEGVGMELGVRDGFLTVVAPLKDSPAARAGVLSGDIVLSIDGRPSKTMPVEEAVKYIRGKKGTVVRLTFERKGADMPVEISIVRDTIHIPVINTVKRDDGVFEISIYSFSADMPQLFRDALREFMESRSQKMLLDVRGNPGGYLGAAVAMASFFLPVGEVVVSEDFEDKSDNVVHRSIGYNVFRNYPLKMAILVDEGSASASEILAGALQEHGIATLVGEQTFGKGSVQELVELGEGAKLKITIARWLTPKGTSISEGGLTPDIKVERTALDFQAGRDPQKDAAVAWLLAQ